MSRISVVLGAIAAFVAGGMLAGTASAATLTYNFSGVWDAGSMTGVADVIGVGFSGAVTIDTSQADFAAGTPLKGQFFPLGNLALLTSGHSFASGNNNLFVETAVPPDGPYSWGAWNHSTTAGPSLDGTPVYDARVQIVIDTAKANDSIVPDNLNLATLAADSFVASYLQLCDLSTDPSCNRPYFSWNLRGHLTAFALETSPVPLPAALPLFAAAIGGVGAWGAIRRRKAV